MYDLQHIQEDNLVNYKSKRDRHSPTTDAATNLENKMKSLSQRESIEKLKQLRRSSDQDSPSRLDRISMMEKGNRFGPSLLPSIMTSNVMQLCSDQSVFGDEKSPKKNYGISTVGGTTLMSHREQGYYTSKEMANLRVGEQRRAIHNSFVVQSNHYKYNRIKEGGWGSMNRYGEKLPFI